MQQKNKDHELINDLTSGKVLSQIVGFAVPTMFSDVLQITYNLVDLAIVGRFLGSPGLSAVSSSTDLLQLFLAFSTGFTAAIQVLVSQIVGSRDYTRLRCIIGTSLTFMALAALAFTLIGVCFVDQFINLLNVPEAAVSGAIGYCTVCFIGMAPTFLYSALAAIMRGMGDSRRPLVFIGIASVLNVALDILFVGGLGLGVHGAAVATVIAQSISFILSLLYLIKKQEFFHFDFNPNSFRIKRQPLMQLLKLGVPFFIQFGVVDISRVFVASYVNSFGLTISAVTGVGARITSFANIVSNPLNTAGTTIIAQNYGAKKWARIKHTLSISLLLGLSFAAVMSGVVILFPDQIFGLFTTEQAVLLAAKSYVVILVLDFFGSACRQPMSALLHGVGNGKLNILVAFLDGLVFRTGLAIGLGIVLKIGIMGFWLSNSVAGFVPFFVGAFYFFHTFRPMIKADNNIDSI